MSITKKISLIFTISLILISFSWYKINIIIDEKIELIQKQNYLQASNELYKFLSQDDKKSLNKRLLELNYKIIDKKNKVSSIYEYKNYFGYINILKDKNIYYLDISYLDDEIFLYDNSQDIEIDKKNEINYFFVAILSMVIITYIIILKIVNPLKNIAKKIDTFGSGEYSTRIEYNQNDEIGKVSKKFNTMATNIQNLISARERLLKDIGHEIRTPITKAKYTLQMIEDNKYTNILKNAINQIDTLTNELLEIEKFKVEDEKNIKNNFLADTLIIEALSRLMISDDEVININVIDNFNINSNIKYISIALKNLIDNSIKYATKLPIIIEVSNNKISIKNLGEKLKYEIDYYLQPFTQEKNERDKKGYGLGLNIVKNILDFYNYNLSYEYQNGYNIFCIHFE